MAKRKVLDKVKAREKRDQLLASAASAQLSLTDGVRTMREIAGMTQEEFARHRGVSARAVKALELGQGNPTVALLNRIGEFFGLEVAFVPKRPPPEPDGVGHRVHTTEAVAFPSSDSQLASILRPLESDADFLDRLKKLVEHESRAMLDPGMQDVWTRAAERPDPFDLLQQQVKEMERLNSQLENLGSLNARLEGIERLAAELEQFRTLKGS